MINSARYISLKCGMEHELDLGFQKYENKKMSIPELVHSDLLAKNSKKYKINNIHKQANGF